MVDRDWLSIYLVNSKTNYQVGFTWVEESETLGGWRVISRQLKGWIVTDSVMNLSYDMWYLSDGFLCYKLFNLPDYTLQTQDILCVTCCCYMVLLHWFTDVKVTFWPMLRSGGSGVRPTAASVPLSVDKSEYASWIECQIHVTGPCDKAYVMDSDEALHECERVSG